MRLPKGGQACPLPPVPGTPIAQHLANNAGAPVPTPPSVPQPSVAKPATATPPIATAVRPWVPTKATSFTQKNTRTQQGATIVDLEYNGQIVGTLAQLPNGKWTVRDANGQGIGKQVHTSWLARKLLSDYLNTKGGNIAPAPAPSQPAPIAPTPKPAPPLPTPPPAPASTPTRPPAPVKTPPAPVMPKTPTSTPVSLFSSPDGGTALGGVWATKMFDSASLHPGAYRMVWLGSGFKWRQTNAWKGGVQTEWDLRVGGLQPAATAAGLPEITFASFVRTEGGYSVRVNPEILKIWRENYRKNNPGTNPSALDLGIPEEIVFSASNPVRAMTLAKKLFVRGFTGNEVKYWVDNNADNLVAKAAQKELLTTPLEGKRQLAEPETLQQGRIDGKDMLWKLSEFELREIAELHNATGRRMSGASDAGLDKIAELQGWAAGRPTLTSLRHFYAEIKKGDHMWLRGDTTHKYASQYKLWAKMHYGKGVYGNGTYSAHLRHLDDAGVRGGWTNQIESAVSTAKDYASGDHNTEGPITLGRLKRDSRIIDQEAFTKLLWDDAQLVSDAFNAYEVAFQKASAKNSKLTRTEFDENPDNFELVLDYSRAKIIQGWMQDQNSLGLIAALHGIDAIIIYPTATTQRHNWGWESKNVTENGVSYYKTSLQGNLREYGPRDGWAYARESSNQYTLLLNRSASIVASGDMHVWSGKMPTKSNYTGEVRTRPKPAQWSRLDPELYTLPRDASETLRRKKLTLEQFLEDLHSTMERGGDWEAVIQDWHERYERAVMRGTKAVTITFEESRGFEEIFAKEDNK
jgi:hypothetical protein